MEIPPHDAQAFTKWLGDENACSEALQWQAGKTLTQTWESCERGDWLEWLLSCCGYQWTAPAWAEYQKVTAPALAKYEKVTAAEIRRIVGNPFKEGITR